MRVLQTNVCIGLGDLICMKGQTDPFKDQFDQIRITLDRNVINTYRRNDVPYSKFLNDVCKLFFSEKPYMLNVGNYPIKGMHGICKEYNLPFVKPNLKYLLCKGDSLNLGEDYIIINTKVRTFPRQRWNEIRQDIFNLLNLLANKYKIVILGEKVVEQSLEYQSHGPNNVYCIYSELIQNLKKDRVLDLTIPALGITAPNLIQVQQDCLIMSQAKFVMLFGLGGAFCMANATSNTIGYRCDNEELADELYNNKVYDDAFITKNFDFFKEKVSQWI